MAGRATQSQHPDVEALQAELAVLEGQKGIILNEVLAISADKKRLTEEFDAEKVRIDEELAQKHREGGAELEILDRAIATAREQKTTAELEAENARKVADALNTVRDTHQAAVAALTTTQEAIATQTEELSRLIVSKELKGQIAQHTEALTSLKEMAQAVETEIAANQEQLRLISADVTHTLGLFDELKAEHGKMGEHKETLVKELGEVLDQVTKRSEVLAGINGKIADIETQVADHTAAMEAKEAAITERMANAARLEAHVDEKLQHLKELENRFTTEHLARMGYTKTA
jgi:chromosome segregation ATPase